MEDLKFNQVYHADFLNNTLPDKCAKLIIADPPYFEVKGAFDFVWKSFDDYLKDVEKWAVECKRLLADNGTLFWYGHAKRIAYAQVIFDKYFKLESSLVWEKKECQTLQSCPTHMRTFAPVTERILMYSNESCGNNDAERNYKYQLGMKHAQLMEPIISYLIEEMLEAGFTCSKIDEMTGTCMASHWFARTSQWTLPSKEWYQKLQELFNQKYLKKNYEYLLKDYEFLKKDYELIKKKFNLLRRPFNQVKLQTDVLKFSQESHITKMFDHETKKPETLTRALILTCSNPNDLIIVPFSGSGTECAMAIKENRQCLGFETNLKYVEMSNNRIKESLRRPMLF